MVGDALTNHPDVRKVGFTGSTEVGKEIMRWLVHGNRVTNQPVSTENRSSVYLICVFQLCC